MSITPVTTHIAASATVALSVGATAVCTFAAATGVCATTMTPLGLIATVAFAALALLGANLSFASIIAWTTQPEKISKYFDNVLFFFFVWPMVLRS